MTKRDLHDEPAIELGQASVETKGQAIFDSDPDGSKLRYVAGIADE